MDKIPMTAAGFAALEAELKRRQQEERPRIIQAISEARSHGDLSENAEYHSAKESQSLNEGRIAELEDKISRAEVIDVSKLSGNQVRRDGHARGRRHGKKGELPDRWRE
jgi:transcription elongation factor GreA